MAITREEHQRNQRRRARQLLGAVILLLAFIGVLGVLNVGVGALRSLFDDSQERAEYENRLEGLVMFDPLPFEGGIQNCNDTTLRSAAVWGTVYAILETPTGLTNYELDPFTEQVLLPAVEVDAYLAKLVGPDFKLTHHTLEMEDMTVEYDEARQSYLIPITGGVGNYDSTVVELFKRSGQLHVTVGYIPSYYASDLTTSVPTEPVKYMDYLFERSNGNWYLVGLTESERKPEATPAPTAQSLPLLQDDSSLEQAIMDGAGAASSSVQSEADSSSAASSAASASSDSE